MGNVSAQKVRAFCEQLGTYDCSCIQSTFPNLSRYQISKLIAPYSVIKDYAYVNDGEGDMNRWRRYTIYEYVGDDVLGR